MSQDGGGPCRGWAAKLALLPLAALATSTSWSELSNVHCSSNVHPDEYDTVSQAQAACLSFGPSSCSGVYDQGCDFDPPIRLCVASASSYSSSSQGSCIFEPAITPAPTAQPDYVLITNGRCDHHVTSLQECMLAAQSLGWLGNGNVVNDNQGGSPFDPPYCYLEGGNVKFDATGLNTGGCTSVDRCLCSVATTTTTATTATATTAMATSTTVCQDLDGDAEDELSDGCAEYRSQPVWCNRNGQWDDADFTAEDMCCACGGGGTGAPTAPPTASPTAAPTPWPMVGWYVLQQQSAYCEGSIGLGSGLSLSECAIAARDDASCGSVFHSNAPHGFQGGTQCRCVPDGDTCSSRTSSQGNNIYSITPTPEPTAAPTLPPTPAPTDLPTPAPTAPRCPCPATHPVCLTSGIYTGVCSRAPPTSLPSGDSASLAFPSCPSTQVALRDRCDADYTAPPPTMAPTPSPTSEPTWRPTAAPTAPPTASPTAAPPSASPTTRSTAARTDSPTRAPTGEPAPAVGLQLTVLGVDFAALSRDVALLTSFEGACRTAIAELLAEVDEQQVAVVLSAGSVLVTSTILVPSGSSADTVTSQLQDDAAAVASSVSTSVAGVDGIAAAMDGEGISVTGLQVTVATTTAAAATTSPSEKENGSASIFDMFPGGELGLGVAVAAGMCIILSTLTVCNIVRWRIRRHKHVWGNELPPLPRHRDIGLDGEDNYRCEEVGIDVDDYLSSARAAEAAARTARPPESKDAARSPPVSPPPTSLESQEFVTHASPSMSTSPADSPGAADPAGPCEGEARSRCESWPSAETPSSLEGGTFSRL